MLKACWKRVESSLNRFKLSRNVDSNFPFLSKNVEWCWSRLNTLFNNCRTHACSHQAAKVNMAWFMDETRLDERDWFLVLSSSQSNFAKVLFLLLAQCWNRFNGLRTTFCVQHLPNIRSTFIERMLVKCWNRLNGPLLSETPNWGKWSSNVKGYVFVYAGRVLFQKRY